jgi:uncharacterized GH25 family protein
MRRWVGAWVVMVAGTAVSQAHFVWIEADQTGEQVEIRSGFGEFGTWLPEYAEQVKRTVYQFQPGDQPASELALSWEASRQMLLGSAKSSGAGAIRGECVWGLFGKSEKDSALLTFYPKGMYGPIVDWKSVKPAENAKLEIVPVKGAGGITLLVMKDGRPLEGAKLKLFPPGSTSSTPAGTGPDGTFDWKVTQPGRYGVAVVHREAGSGEHEGKAYQNLMKVATLTFEYRQETARSGQ